MKLTAAQFRVLQLAAKDGSLIFGGIDATAGIRRDVVKKLAAFGLLKWRAPSSLNEESSWVITDEGKSFIVNNAKETA